MVEQGATPVSIVAGASWSQHPNGDNDVLLGALAGNLT